MRTPVLFGIIILLLWSPTLALACWSLDERKEIDGFSELDDVLVLSFKDAISCKPIANAQIKLGELDYTSDARGYLQLPMAPFAAQMDARLAIQVRAPGYIPLVSELEVAAGTVLNRRMVLSPALPPGKLRFVLQWGMTPEDLDLHLKGPDFHISYRNMRNAPNRARLDHDEREGIGPETITLDRVLADAEYGLWVDNFSNDDYFSGYEAVYVYQGDALLRKIRLPRTTKRAVQVLRIRGGNIQFINQPSPRP